MQAVTTLRSIVHEAPARLAKLSDDAISRRPTPEKWSPKQELGHLLDSAIMNHVRLMRVLTEDNPTLSGYDGESCVTAHDYHSRSW